ncbi:MAG: GlsB/YeaQ/YmgE family stress response membrane protein [Propionibacteriaceae bacterium]
MGWLGTIIGLIIIGLIAGFIARAVVPGKQNLSVLQTLILGIVGSFVGGFLGKLIFGSGNSLIQTSSWIGSIIGAIIVLVIYLQVVKRRARA